MKASWIDTMSHGCSVKSAGYVFRNGRYEIDEIRDLPAITFRQPPRTLGMSQAPPNPLMPGVVWDVKEKRVRVFQTLDDTLALHELKNFTIIRDPSARSRRPSLLPPGVSYHRRHRPRQQSR